MATSKHVILSHPPLLGTVALERHDPERHGPALGLLDVDAGESPPEAYARSRGQAPPASAKDPRGLAPSFPSPRASASPMAEESFMDAIARHMPLPVAGEG